VQTNNGTLPFPNFLFVLLQLLLHSFSSEQPFPFLANPTLGGISLFSASASDIAAELS
jgi:hypothetical protein